MKYKLIRASCHEDLNWLLEDLLLKGWRPYGSPYAHEAYHYQALVKDLVE